MEKIKLELTKKEFGHLINLIDSISAMIGSNGGDQDEEWSKDVKTVDKALLKNGYKRIFN